MLRHIIVLFVSNSSNSVNVLLNLGTDKLVDFFDLAKVRDRQHNGSCILKHTPEVNQKCAAAVIRDNMLWHVLSMLESCEKTEPDHTDKDCDVEAGDPFVDLFVSPVESFNVSLCKDELAGIYSQEKGWDERAYGVQK